MAEYSQAYDKVCPEGDGGNMTIVNQDEAMILESTTQGLATRVEGREDDSHVNPLFRHADAAGS